MCRLCLSVLLFLLPTLALANIVGPIRDRADFMAAVNGKDLRIGLYNLSLRVLPNGTITGSALGWGISGTWAWQDGYFCRTMDWSGYAIPYNCQLVEALDASRLRFISDKGQGQSASFRLR